MATRSDVIRMLAEMVKLTALDEGSPQAFKVRAYENAMAGIEAHPEDIGGMSKAELTKIKGVGNSTAEKILEFEKTGKVAKLEDLREKYPPAFVELTKIPGLGPKTLLALRSQLGIEDIEGLKEAVANQQLRELPGLGEKSEEKIAKAIDRLGLHGKDRRTPLAEVYGLAHLLYLVGRSDASPRRSAISTSWSRPPIRLLFPK